MKKKILGLFSTFVLILSAVPLTFAECDNSEYGYIFTLQEESVSLFDADTFENIDTISDNIFHADTLSDIETVSKTANVGIIAEDMPLELFEAPDDTYYYKQWNITATNADTYWNNNVSGQGVKVGVIDTGIYREHPDFEGVTVNKGINICAVMDKNADKYYYTNDENGHGTGVTSIIAAAKNNGIGIAGITDKCVIEPICVYDAESKYSLSVGSLLTAMEYAYTSGCDVINLSLGFKNPSEELIEITEGIVNKITEAGTIIVAATGNDGKTTNAMEYPAACENVIGVASAKRDNGGYIKSETSTANESVFISAPGDMVITADICDELYAYRKGTSFSAPVVSAAAIGAKQMYPEINAEAFMEILKNTAVDLETEGYDINTGYGLIDFEGVYNKIVTLAGGAIVQNVSVKQTDNGYEAVVTWSSDKEADIIAAAYDSNNMLLEVQKHTSAGGTETFILSEVSYLKVFVWEHNKVRPLTTAKTYSVNNTA